MSMKRSKQRVYTRRRDDETGSGSGKNSEPEKSWGELMEGQPDEAFAAYSMKSRFAKGALLQHPTFGRGVVMRVEGTHMDVLFSEGKKTLAQGLGG